MSVGCERCRARWDGPARWCGRCGAPLPARPTTAHAGAATTAVGTRVLLVAVLLVAATALWQLEAPSGGDATAGEVDVLSPDGPPSEEAAAVAPLTWSALAPAAREGAARGVAGRVLSVTDSGRVTAHRAADGGRLWETQLPAHASEDPQLAMPVAGTVVAGDRVVFLEVTSGERLGIVALPLTAVQHASTGPSLLVTDGARIAAAGLPDALLWSRAVPAGQQATVTAHGAYLSDGSRLTRLGATTGQPRWTVELGGQVQPLPAVTGRSWALHAVAGDQPALVAVTTGEGRTAWRVPLDGAIQDVAVGDGRIAVVTGGGDDPLELVLLLPDDDGRYVPRRQAQLAPSGELAELVLVGRQVAVVVDGPAREVVVTSADGFPRLRRDVAPDTRVSSPDGRLLVLADGRQLRGVALATGTERFAVPLRDPRPVPGTLDVVHADGRLVAVRGLG